MIEKKVTICKICNKKFNDINNVSGSLSKHLLNKHNINKYDLKYFELNSIKLDNILKCPYCNWESIDYNNKSGMFTQHLIKNHKINIDDFLLNNPQYNNLWKIRKQKINRIKFINKSVDNNIICEVCGEKMKKLTNTHLKKHNITPTDYKIKYKKISTVSKTTSILQSNKTKINNIKMLEYYKENNIIMPWHNTESNIKKMKLNYNIYIDRINKIFYNNISFDDYINKAELNFTCKQCNNTFTSINRYPRCYKCEPKFYSKEQEEIINFINNLGINIEINNRKILNGVELDIFIPDYKIGIEYNGLYWHSENNGKDKNYHLQKTLTAESQNIKLIHIFSDEWNLKKNIVKNRIKYMLNKIEKTIYARKCIIKEIISKEKNEFLINYHLQGGDKSNIKLGAYYEDELVAVMTFGDLRKSLGSIKKENEYELIRFATKYKVIGIASKLLSYFIKNHNPKRIISYADRRWSNGNLYEKIGFKFVSITKPNYWYTKDYNIREYRYKFRKGVLLNEGFNKKLSESEIMKIKGYDKIWDCGNLKYEMIL